MRIIRNIGGIIRVSDSEDVQYWADSETPWVFLPRELVLPFTLRVEGELKEDGHFFGLFGPIITGPDRVLGLSCSIMQRDIADWSEVIRCTANFKLGLGKVIRNHEFKPPREYNWPFYAHPEGTRVKGYPKYSRFGVIEALQVQV